MAQERKKNKQQQTEAQRLAHRKAVIEHSDNKFVAELTKNMDAFIYTKDFYVALYKQLESGMTSIEAYESLRISNGTAQSFFNYTGTHFRSEFQDSESFADVFAPNQVSNNPNFTGSNANVFRNSFYCHLCYPLI